MNDQDKSTRLWTPTRIFSFVLVLTSVLLNLRLLFRTTPAIRGEGLFPLTLLMVGLSLSALQYLEVKEKKTEGIVMLIILSIGFFLLLSIYLKIY